MEYSINCNHANLSLQISGLVQDCIDFSAQAKDFDSKVHGANVGPILGWQDPGGPHVGPTNLAIWGVITIWC